MSSGSSMAYSAPSGNSTGSPNAHYDYADEPLPPKGQQSQSWLQSTVHFVRGFLSPMPEDLQARFAKAKELHHRDHRSKWPKWIMGDNEASDEQSAYKIYKDIAPKLLLAEQKAEAGEAFEAAGLLELKYYNDEDLVMMGNDSMFNKAYLAYVDVLPLGAARCLQQMIKLRLDKGDFRTAAQLQEKLGDLYMKSCDDPDEAIAAWQKARNWFRNEQALSTAVACYTKAATAFTEKGDYYKAIEAWEWCAENYPDKVKQTLSPVPLFHAGLCHVATADTVALSRAIPHYANMVSSFGRSKECRFLFDLSKVMQDGDEERYKIVRDSYDRITPLDGWRLRLVDVGLERMKGAEEDFS